MVSPGQLTPITLGTDWSSGDAVSPTIAGGGIPAQKAHIKHGTAASPVTIAGPTFKVSRTDAVSHATQAAAGESAVAIETSSAIFGSIKAQGNSDAQVIGVLGEASSTSTSAQQFNDVCGVFGYSRHGGDGVAAGGYFDGALLSSATSAAFGLGIETRVTNVKAAHTYVSNGPSKTMALWVNAGPGGVGSFVSACAIQVGGIFEQCDVGLGFNQNSCVTSTIRDDSSSVTSLDIRGTHSSAINIANGSGPVALNANYMHLAHIGTPGAGGANSARLFAQTTGGKVSLKVIFPSGAAQTIATEP